MLQIVQFFGALSATLFAGAAVYINVAEHPARMGCSPRAALAQWAPSYKRATVMQAPLALTGLAAGVAAWLLGGGVGWLVAGLLIGAVIPFTFIIIMPTNRRLLSLAPESEAAQVKRLLQRWASLHGIRSVLGLAAAVICLWQLTSG